MANYLLTSAAREHLVSIGRYTKEHWGEIQMKKYFQEIENTLILLTDNPSFGRNCAELGTNVFRFPCQSHMIYYSVKNQDIIVIGVLHKNMLPARHLHF